MLRTACLVLLLLTVGGCTGGSSDDAATKDVMTAPKTGDCRSLGPDDLEHPSNASAVTPCSDDHTAETFAVGTLPAALTEADSPDDPRIAAYLHDRCQPRFQRFLGGDESLVLRSTMTWVWFRPTATAWSKGAHWWRCDVVGGGEQSRSFVKLPDTAKGVLLGKPDDRWLVCVDGPSVSGAVKIPCSQDHTWRAVTTIVLGKGGDGFPGDKAVAARTRDFCSESVGGWLNYPTDYDFGYTYFHETEWSAGNRRSICWAKTSR